VREVKIREVTEAVSVPLPLGGERKIPRKYLQLYFPASGELVLNGIYTLKQGEQEEACSVINGEVRGANWIDREQAIFIR
jgi:hypothetical protein